MKRVLVVDDDSACLEAIAKLIQSAGYEVIQSDAADRGYLIATERAPDLIISDVLMPDKTGLGMLKDLRTDPRTKNLPVIFYTAWDMANELALANEVIGESVHVVKKPAGVDELMNVVRKALGEVPLV